MNADSSHQSAVLNLNKPKKFHISNFMLRNEAKLSRKSGDKLQKKSKYKVKKTPKKEPPQPPTPGTPGTPKPTITTLYGTQNLTTKEVEKAKREHTPIEKSTECVDEPAPYQTQEEQPAEYEEPYITEYHYIKAKICKEIRGEFAHLMHVECHVNGGALVLHAYQQEIDKLPVEKHSQFADEFMRLAMGEDANAAAHFVMAIVHGAAKPMPDFIDYLAEKHPRMTAKMGGLGKSDIETMTMTDVKEKIYKTYSCGTYRAGPLLQLSLVGLAQEEVG